MRKVLVAVVVLVSGCGTPPQPPAPSPSPSVGGIAVGFVGNDTCSTAGQSPYAPAPRNTNGPPVGQPIDEMPHRHAVEGVRVTYLHNPPTSGCHYNLGTGIAPLSPGVYTPQSAAKLAPEYWVHNLEHGYVVVTYNCPNGCAADLGKLTNWYRSLAHDAGGGVPYAKFIAVPYPQQRETWDIVSWDWFDPIGSTLNLDEIQRFYANHTNEGPEGPSAA